MKNYFLILVVLCTSLMFSCDGNEELLHIDDSATSITRSGKVIHDYLVRDFGDQFGIFEVNSGDFIYCADCQNSMNISSDITFSGTVEFNHDGTLVYVYDRNGSPYFSVSLGRTTTDITSNSVWQNITNYSVGTIGYSYGNTETSALNGSNAWIPDNYDDFISELPLCQCVGNSSTPCTSDGNDQTDGCDVGGPGSSGCGASSGTAMNGGIMGTGGGGSSSGGCSISCDAGSYACCDNTGG